MCREEGLACLQHQRSDASRARRDTTWRRQSPSPAEEPMTAGAGVVVKMDDEVVVGQTVVVVVVVLAGPGPDLGRLALALRLGQERRQRKRKRKRTRTRKLELELEQLL